MYLFIYLFILDAVVRVCAVGWGTALQAGRSRVQFLIGSLTFFIQSSLPHFDSEVDSASNWKEHQESSLGDKGGRCVGLTTLPLSCSDCLIIPGASTSCITWGLSTPYRESFTFYGWWYIIFVTSSAVWQSLSLPVCVTQCNKKSVQW
jgi:hypothetical protein